MSNPTTREPNKARRRIYTAARIILGLLLVVNAPVGTLVKSPANGPLGDALLEVLWHSPWIMILAKLVELIAGILLLTNRFVPLSLTLFAPVLVNILGFQASFAPQVLPLGFVLLLLTLWIAWENRAAYAPLLRARLGAIGPLVGAALILALGACRPLASAAPTQPAKASTRPTSTVIDHGYERVGDVNVFFREAGSKDAPTLLFLHGFPSSSHQYRRLIELLGSDLHVVAPDYPGFGFSDAPVSITAGGSFAYTFDHLTDVIEGFCKQRGLTSFVVYMFDFGAPVGFRLALRHPDWVRRIITQNGNAYTEGIAPHVAEMIRLDAKTEPEKAVATRSAVLTLEATKSQYLDGASRPERVAPEAWLLDQHFLDQPGRKAVMLSLFDDYKTNVAAYPVWQRFLREHRPPTLVVWGRRDPIFVAAGARAWLRDVPDAELHLLDGGHFMLEEHAAAVAPIVLKFVRTRTRGGRAGSEENLPIGK
jgi:pimeloyl-ACP methyl ester carboxylesterase